MARVLAAEVRQRLHEDGVAEVLDTAYQPGSEDYSALVGQLQRAAADVVYIGGYGPDAARIVRAARERGDDLQLVGGHALGMAEFWGIAGAAGEGTIFTGRPDAGVGSRGSAGAARVARPWPWAAPDQPRHLCRGPDLGAGGGAGPAPSILAAVNRGLHRGRFETVLGRVAFDAKGDLEDAAWQWQVWRDGDYEPLDPTMPR